jgi:zinc/manganese transport system ATP-binding protein
MADQNPPLIQLDGASLERGERRLWHGLDLTVKPGEFVAILGPNGAGKTSLLKVLLGLLPLSSGTASVSGQPPQRGNQQIGYIPQLKRFDDSLPIRGIDLVELGLNGYRFGVHNHRKAAALVAQAITAVGAKSYATRPIGRLSGGEQQRLRIAQALVGQPDILLCDEPLLSLDLASQQGITARLDKYRQRNKAAILFVTHEVNPILPYVDRILYVANGRWVIDTPDRVLQSKTLTKLYGTPVEVLRIHGRVLVVGAEDEALTAAGAHHAHEKDIGDEH